MDVEGFSNGCRIHGDAVAIGVELNSRELACVVFDQDLEACSDIKVADFLGESFCRNDGLVIDEVAVVSAIGADGIAIEIMQQDNTRVSAGGQGAGGAGAGQMADV